MRRICLLIVLLVASTARAQPVSFELKGDVPIGQKPVLRVTAPQQVTDLPPASRSSAMTGRTFTMRQAALSKGQAVMLSIGDGARASIVPGIDLGADRVGGAIASRCRSRRWCARRSR